MVVIKRNQEVSMKIGLISPVYKGMHKNANFAGIWGKEEKQTDNNIRYDYGMEADCGTYKETITKPYYPFLDESDEDIKKAEKDYSKFSIREDDLIKREYSQNVKIMPRIPVTAAEYKAYISRELLSKQEMEIEDKLKGAHMQQFLNVPPKKLNTQG